MAVGTAAGGGRGIVGELEWGGRGAGLGGGGDGERMGRGGLGMGGEDDLGDGTWARGTGIGAEGGVSTGGGVGAGGGAGGCSKFALRSLMVMLPT